MPSTSIWTVLFQILALLIVLKHSLQCSDTDYLHGDICCPSCSAGKRVKTHCTQTRSTSCAPCEAGKFTNKPNGLEKCISCRSCDPDSNLRVETACTKTSNSVCQPLEGAYCVDFRDGGCARAQLHSSCKPGQYISERGTKDRDTQCSPCQNGTFSHGIMMTSCVPHTDCQSQNLTVVKPGSPFADAVCGGQDSEQHSNRRRVGLMVSLLLAAVAVVGVALV